MSNSLVDKWVIGQSQLNWSECWVLPSPGSWSEPEAVESMKMPWATPIYIHLYIWWLIHHHSLREPLDQPPYNHRGVFLGSWIITKQLNTCLFLQWGRNRPNPSEKTLPTVHLALRFLVRAWLLIVIGWGLWRKIQLGSSRRGISIQGIIRWGFTQL